MVCRLSLLFLLVSLPAVRGATLYVSTAGSDSNPGTEAQPFRTITHAYSLAGPGTTILVAPGTYTDYTSGWGLHLGNSGTASNPIVLESQVRGGAIIDGQFAADRNKAIYLDGSYNIIDGFGITRAPNTGIFVVGNGNQILDDEIDNNGTQGATDPEGQGIYSEAGTSGNVYAGNYIHDNGYAGSNLDHGLYLCGQNEVVANNVVIRQPAYGLQIAGYSTVSNLKVYNNVFAWNGHSGIIVWMAMNGVDIRNNILYGNGRDGVEFWAATGSGVTMDHNLVYGNASASYSFTEASSTCAYTLGTTITSDPLLANETASAFDAHLSAGSPAIGAGLNLSAVFTTDLGGILRPDAGAWDMGAYVYAAANLTPPTVSIASPSGGAVISGSAVSLLANASSSVGIAGVQFKLDGANMGSVFTNAPYGGVWNSTTVPDGGHTVAAVAIDIKGNQTTSSPVTFWVSNTVATLGLPSVSVAGTTTNASRIGPTDGQFTITRSGDTSVPLTIYYTLSGTAANGADYADLSASLTIPAGAASSAITVVPLPSTNLVATETAVLALSADSMYTLGSVVSATVNIAGNSVPSALGRAGGNYWKITWNSVAGKVYGVDDKDTSGGTTWTNLSGPITATGPSTSYIDTTASKHTSRYYIVYVTN